MTRSGWGLDLGTSHCALAHADRGIFPLRQCVERGQWQERDTLPSVLYLPLPGEGEGEGAQPLLGVWARRRGGDQPQRVVHSAKSWLGSAQMNPREAFLPWGAPAEEVPLLSPFDATRHLLAHMHRELGEQRGDEPVVLTVPASFDEGARQLTREAAADAGWGEVILLEEPLAALYAWLGAQGENWRENLAPGDRVLVCDVGGGTTDFSMVAASEQDGELALERIAVGDHLLLGGDNMDLALAHSAAKEAGLDRWQLRSLIHGVREAKERLLSGEADKIPIAVASRGSSLMAATKSVELTAEQVTQSVVEGFFPRCGRDDRPLGDSDAALQDFGLSYEREPAITKHLAAFLERCQRSDPEAALPTKVLFNGGVFNAAALRARLLTVLRSWAGDDREIGELEADHLDLAVARGAAYFAHLKASASPLRIKAGTSHAYYIGVEEAGMAIPGVTPQMNGLCLVPLHTEEGTQLPPLPRTFALQTGGTARFALYSSADRPNDGVGGIVEDADHALGPCRTLEAELPLAGRERGRIPVQLTAQVTDIGTLEVFLRHTQNDQSWRLEFNLRND